MTQSALTPQPNVMRAVTLKVASVVVFTAMASCIKAASTEVSPGEAVFFRSFFAIPVILGWLAMQGNLRTGLKTKNFLGHLWRGLIGTAAMACGFTGLALLPLPEVTAIGFAAPIITVVLAAMFLGEKVRLFRLSAVLVGLLGVTIILSPRFSTALGDDVTALAALGAVAALASAFLRAVALVFTRKLIVHEGTPAIVFYFSSIAAFFGFLTLPFNWTTPSTLALILLISSGILGGLGQILLTSSYRFAEAGVIAPFDYTSMLLALAVGFFVFGEVPTPIVLVGAALITLAGVFIIFRERKLGLARGPAKSVTPSQG